MVDSSPMYGSSEGVIGDLAQQNNDLEGLWFATKVWADGRLNGKNQIQKSSDFFRQQIKLLQVHNLRDFSTHYPYLQSLKENGIIKYIGITHYLNSAHEKVGQVLQTHPVDFIQIDYNIDNPHAEKRLIPLASHHNVAVIVNRPFQTGRLFRLMADKPIPGFAKERGITSWATYFLKYIISHPIVTCTIPATTQVGHVEENLEAGRGWIPDWKEHLRMEKEFHSIN